MARAGWNEVGEGRWDLGSLEGHGFGGSLFPRVPPGGLQVRCGGRCRQPMGLFGPLCPGRPSPPQSQWALPETGRAAPGDRGQCGGEGGKDGRLRA